MPEKAFMLGPEVLGPCAENAGIEPKLVIRVFDHGTGMRVIAPLLHLKNYTRVITRC
jgi:hypothetical protein